MIRTFIVAISTLLLFSGCSFKPNMAKIDTKFKSSEQNATIKDRWWQDFNDVRLNAFVNDVLKNNSDLKIALNRVDIARAALGLSSLEELPTIGYKVDATRKNNFPVAPNSHSSAIYSASFVFNYELDFWGRVANSTDAAVARLNQSIYGYESARLTLVSSAISLYFQLQNLYEKEEILKDTIKNYEANLALRQKQHNAGIVDSMVIYQLSAQVDGAKAKLVSLMEAKAKVNSAIIAMSSKNYDELLYGSFETLDIVKNIPSIPSGIPSDLLLRRPDVAVALEKLKESNFNVGAAKAEYFPKLSLTGILGFASTDLDNLFRENSSSWSVAGSLAGPLFSFGRVSKGVEIANLKQREAFLNYDKSLKEAFSDVRYALASREAANAQMQSLANLTASLQKVVEMADRRYKEGYSDYSELLDAEKNLLNAKLNLSSAKLSVLNSTVGLYKSLGGGFKLEDEEMIKELSSTKNKEPSSSKNPFSKN